MNNEKSYTILGKPSCGFCQQAKSLLESLQIPYTYIDLSLDSNLAFQYKAKGYRSVPIIELEGGVIGGFRELQAHLIENM